ncbi:hypothetical protein [Kordiimonas aquimaris]|uniref:hypothetical protein n=1 Tax=Kordiimonas aquimaris TaxID=707591 RepID=UPI0021D110A9|nr:hypothetical protein [Kordiimonas aquimaris]
MPSPQFDSLPAMPAAPAPAAIRVRSRQRTRASQSESGHIFTRSYGGQVYEVTLSYNPMTRTQAAPLIAFLQSRKGRDSKFKVDISGLAEAPGLHVGSFANFSDSTKLYLITGTSPVEVTPSRSNTANPFTDTVFMYASLVGDVQEVSLGRGGLIRLEVDLVERLPL